MLTTSTVTFKKKERKILKRLAKLNIASIVRLQQGESEVDLNKDIAMLGISRDSMDEQHADMLTDWDLVIREPERIASISDNVMSMLKHSLYTYVSEQKYPKTRASLFRKLYLLEKLQTPSIQN